MTEDLSYATTTKYPVFKDSAELSFQHWKPRITIALDAADVLEVVEGIEKEPDTDDKEKHAKWTALNKRARNILMNAVGNDLTARISENKKAADGWKSLLAAYESKTMSNRHYLLREFMNLKLAEGESMTGHINATRLRASELDAIGEKISDAMMVATLQGSISHIPHYDNLIKSIDSMDSDKVTPSYVTSRYTAEAQRLIREEGLGGGALFTKGGSGGNKGGLKSPFQSKKTPTPPAGMTWDDCWKCGGARHFPNPCTAETSKKKAGGTAALVSGGDNQEEEESEGWLFAVGHSNNDTLLADSGATHSLVKSRDLLHHYTSLKTPYPLRTAANQLIYAEGFGSLVLFPKGSHDKFVIARVLYVPEASANLLSITALAKNGVFMNMNSEGATFVRGGEEVFTAKTCRMQLVVDVKMMDIGSAMVTVSLEDWHQRLGHLNFTSIKKLAAGAATGITLSDSNLNSSTCVPCQLGKHARRPFNNQGTISTTTLKLIHSDVVGPMQTPSKGGSRYFVTFIDDCTRFPFVYFLKAKSEVFDAFIIYKALVENQTGMKIKTLRSDNGGEYTNGQFSSFLKTHGIASQTTVPYSPQQNGVAERLNRTVMEMARCMLKGAGLDNGWWAEAVAHAMKTLTFCPHSALKDRTPFELWNNKIPDISHLQTFGTKCWAHIPKERRQKLDDQSVECILLGYLDGTKGYKLWDVKEKRVLKSRDVTFDLKPTEHPKTSCPSQLPPRPPRSPFRVPFISQAAKEIPVVVDNNVKIVDSEAGRQPGNQDDLNVENYNNNNRENGEDEPLELPAIPPSSALDDSPLPLPVRYSQRQNKGQPGRPYWLVQDGAAFFAVDLEEEPVSYEAAVKSGSAKEWKQAMQSEIDSIRAENTWKLVDLPVGRKAIGSKWVFKIKRDVDGRVTVHKARLVAQGFAQRAWEYGETFSPVVKGNTERLLFALAAKLDLELHGMDVKSAFLQGRLIEEVYLKQPKGFVESGQEEKVCQLVGNLYGLKQAGRTWWTVMDKFLRDSGFTRSQFDHSLYFKPQSPVQPPAFIGLYVDDLTLAFKDPIDLKKFKALISDRFKMKDLGELTSIIGLKITRNRSKRTIDISQEQYIDDMLVKHNLEDCKPNKLPISVKSNITELKPDDPRLTSTETKLYQSLIGSLNYASTMTRPDISYAVNFLARFIKDPGPVHLTAAKGVLRYLKGTKHYYLRFGDGEAELKGYGDADWGNDTKCRASVTGYVFSFAGGPLSWQSVIDRP